MNGIIEKVIAPGVILLAWVSSFEFRLRGKVGKDRFGDVIHRLDRIENLLIKIDKDNGLTHHK